MNRISAALLCIGVLAGTVSAELGEPKDIPESGRVRVDGNLLDWRRAEWTPLKATLDGNPANISNARWSLAWDEDGIVYIAVQYDDADIVLEDTCVNTNAQDCIEIYVRGDTGSHPEDYSELQDSAQQYTFGLSKNRQITWKKLGVMDKFPTHNPAKAAVKLDGSTFTYEIMVPLYDSFDALHRRKCSETDFFTDSDEEDISDIDIGLDIAIVDVGKTGYAGMKSENTLTGKRTDANQIAEHTLSD